jgi:hypothetical protein
MDYRYFQAELGRERAAVRDLARAAYAKDGCVAVFAPLLGFASNQALVLGEAGFALPALDGAESHDLSPTLRPATGGRPLAGGVYVHNWFTIDGDAVDEFVDLSGQAWPDFETRFETTIFGLFLAAESATDRAQGARRLLLMTRYRDLGEWQTSRDPTTDAMQIFLRRRDLTRVSLARACLLVPPPETAA